MLAYYKESFNPNFVSILQCMNVRKYKQVNRVINFSFFSYIMKLNNSEKCFKQTLVVWGKICPKYCLQQQLKSKLRAKYSKDYAAHKLYFYILILIENGLQDKLEIASLRSCGLLFLLFRMYIVWLWRTSHFQPKEVWACTCVLLRIISLSRSLKLFCF